MRAWRAAARTRDTGGELRDFFGRTVRMTDGATLVYSGSMWMNRYLHSDGGHTAFHKSSHRRQGAQGVHARVELIHVKAVVRFGFLGR